MGDPEKSFKQIFFTDNKALPVVVEQFISRGKTLPSIILVNCHCKNSVSGNISWFIFGKKKRKQHCFPSRNYYLVPHLGSIRDLKIRGRRRLRKRRWKSEFMFFQSSSRWSVTNFFNCRRTNWHFHVVVVQWRQRNLQKSVMHVQNCCFAN